MDSAGSGSSTAYPRAAISHGFHRQDQVFQLDSGPPCTHSNSGAGLSAAAAAGSTSQARSTAPSLAVVTISVSEPGSGGGPAGPASQSGSPGWLASSRTAAGGLPTAARNAYTERPSGAGHRLA